MRTDKQLLNGQIWQVKSMDLENGLTRYQIVTPHGEKVLLARAETANFDGSNVDLLVRDEVAEEIQEDFGLDPYRGIA